MQLRSIYDLVDPQKCELNTTFTKGRRLRGFFYDVIKHTGRESRNQCAVRDVFKVPNWEGVQLQWYRRR